MARPPTSLSRTIATSLGRLARQSAPHWAGDEPAAVGPLIVPHVRAAYFGVRNSWHVGPRRLLDFLLRYVEAGRVEVEVNGAAISLQPGQFCLLQPGDLVEIRAEGESVTPFIHFDVFYSADRDERYVTRAGETDLTAVAHLVQPRLDLLGRPKVPALLHPTDHSDLHALILRAIAAWTRGGLLGELEADGIAVEIVLAILRDHLPSLEARVPSGSQLAWVPGYFTSNLGRPISVADMAARAGLSTSRFASVFRQRFGMAPHRFLMELRIRHAEDLLRDTDLSQEQIAESCGFSDTAHLSHVFRRSRGRNPGSYRMR